MRSSDWSSDVCSSDLHLLGRWWRSDWPRFVQMTRIGTPIAISHAFEAGVFSAAVMLMGWISTAAVAAHAVALQLASLTFMVPMGLAQAATVRVRSEEHTSELQSLMRISYAVFCLKKKKNQQNKTY